MATHAAHSGSAPVPAPRRVAQEGVINRWQRGVPVHETRVVTPWFLFFAGLFLVGTVLGVARLFGGALGPFTGMTDAFAWGVWKTFNVMALTALGSGALAVGLASWVLGRHHLHTVMRTALVTSFLFYATGLLGLLTDVGRPWNFWNMALPWRWNTESALWEVALAMPIYCALFLLYENGPMVVERLWHAKNERLRGFIRTWHPRIRKTYPFVVPIAYVLPIIHQSSLGALMVLGGHKVHPLWQTDLLPLLYLVQALICGFGSVIVVVMSSCLVWRRPLDVKVLGELADLMSWTTIGWLVLRLGDVIVRGHLGDAFAMDRYGTMFLLETAAVAVPALLLRNPRMRATPRAVFGLAMLACLAGLAYRFIPTTLAYAPGKGSTYFPAVPEVLITLGLVAIVIGVFSIAVKRFAVLPAPLETWYHSVEHDRRTQAESRSDAHGHASHD